jgi:hypothetical protein
MLENVLLTETGLERSALKAAPELLRTLAPQSTPETDGEFDDFLDPRHVGAVTAFQASGSQADREAVFCRVRRSRCWKDQGSFALEQVTGESRSPEVGATRSI